MSELIDEIKIVVHLRHVLYFTNITLFLVISFINWDLLWWWDMGNWAGIDRSMILISLCVINGFTIAAYRDWKKGH